MEPERTSPTRLQCEKRLAWFVGQVQESRPEPASIRRNWMLAESPGTTGQELVRSQKKSSWVNWLSSVAEVLVQVEPGRFEPSLAMQQDRR